MLYSTTPACTSCGHDGDYDDPIEEQSEKRSNSPTVIAAGESETRTPSRANPTAKPISKTPETEQPASPQAGDLMRDLLESKDVSNHRGNPAGTVDADMSDAETVFSNASSAVTLVDPDAVELFTRNITTFHNLGCLWPQLIVRCDTKETGIFVIERLLRRYAKDLTLASREMRSSEMADSRLCLTAARFIRKSRLPISRKIWEAQSQNLSDPAGRFSDIKAPNLEVGQDDDGPIDDDLLFEKIEEILFNNLKGPIFALQANIKHLIKLSNPMSNNIVHRLSTSMNTFIGNTISSLYEPSLSPGYTRLRYTCRCGRRLYDDFKEDQAGALINLRKLLTSYFGGNPVTLKPEDFDPPATENSPKRNRTPRSLMGLWQHVFDRRRKDPRLPWTRQRKDDMELGICSSATANGRTDHIFVLLCLPFMQWAKKLHQLDTCNLKSDQAFFLSLRKRYSLVHQSRPWTSFAKLRRVSSLDFVKFEVYRNELVDIQHSPSMPDQDGEEEARQNYTYDPLPARPNPPLQSNLLMHLFQNPYHADVEPVMYRKIPKKLRDSLEPCPVKGSAVGWGVHFTEGVDWFALFASGLVGFICALVFAVA